MSNSSNDENVFILMAVIVIGLLALGAWEFSAAINVNFETGLSVLLRASVVFAVCIALVKLDLVSLSASIPGLLGGLAWAIFPALDYWSVQATGEMQFGFALSEPEWYAQWYSKTALALLSSFGGYGLSYAISR